MVLAALRYYTSIWHVYLVPQCLSLHPTHGTTLFRKQFESVFKLVSIKVRTVVFRTRPVIPQEKKHRLTHTISSLVPGRGLAGAARDGRIHPLCTPAHAPTAKSGTETPQRVSGMARASYRPFDGSVPWWLRVVGSCHVYIYIYMFCIYIYVLCSTRVDLPCTSK